MMRVCMLGCGGLRALKGRCVSGLEVLCGGGGGGGLGGMWRAGLELWVYVSITFYLEFVVG